MARTARASILDAPSRAVWEVVAAVTRNGEWGGEALGNRWLADATGARPGARFKGGNRRHAFR